MKHCNSSYSVIWFEERFFGRKQKKNFADSTKASMSLEWKIYLVRIIPPASAVSTAEELYYLFVQEKVCLCSSVNYIYDFRNGL